MRPAVIAYYISAHGYGHGVRSCEIIGGLRAAAPDTHIHVVTGLDAAFLRSRLPAEGVSVHRGAFDVGVVQRDSVRGDVAETLQRVKALYEREFELVDGARRFLQEIEADVVVVDIPALPLRAARTLGVRTVAVANFTWAWIYEEYAEQDPEWDPVLTRLRAEYAEAELALRLPFAEPLDVFPNVVDVPLLTVPGVGRRRELHELTGAPLDRTWVLVAFRSLDWDAAALRALAGLEGHAFFTILPLAWEAPNLYAVDPNAISVSDLFATADVILTKPGYGALSECVANDVPMVYVDREDFREYALLEAEIKRFLRHAHVPADDLYRGHVRAALDAASQAPTAPEAVPRGGVEICAQHILGA